MNELNSYIRKSEVHTFVVTKNLQRKICHLIVHFERPEIIPRKYFQASLYIIALCFIDFDSYFTEWKKSYLVYSDYKLHRMFFHQVPIVQNYSSS